VFSCNRKPLDMMAASLEADGVAYGRIDGGVTGKKRHEVVKRFQAGETQVLLGQIIAAGEGINLTRATTVIFNDLSWVPAEHAQAEDRCYRIGQDSKVSVYYMLSQCLLDRVMWDLLEVKRRNIGKFEEGLRSRRHVEVTPEEIMEEIGRRQSGGITVKGAA